MFSVSQLCPTLCSPMNYNPPATSVHGIFHARLLEQVPFPLPGWSFWPRDGTYDSCLQHQQADSSPLVPSRLGERLKWLRLCGDHLGPCSSSQVEFSTGFSRKSSLFSALLSHLAFGLWMRSEYHSKNSVAGWVPGFLPLDAGDGLQRKLTGARVWAPNSWDRSCTLGQLKAHLLNDSM